MKPIHLALAALLLSGCTENSQDNEQPTVRIESASTSKTLRAASTDSSESSYTRGVAEADKPIVKKYIKNYNVPMHRPHMVRADYLSGLEIREYLSEDGVQLNVFETVSREYCGSEPYVYSCCIPTKGSIISRVTGIIKPDGKTAHGLYKVEGVDVIKGGACPASDFYFIKYDETVFEAVEADVMQHIYQEGIEAVIKAEEARQSSAAH